MSDTPKTNNKSKPPKLSLYQVVLSVLAAAFGVQSSKNGERDLSSGNPYIFIIAGLIFTVLFVLTIIAVVNIVIT